MSKQSPRISIITADTGHTSISSAISTILSPKYTVTINNLSGNAFSIYYPFYIYFPNLFRIPFELSQKKSAQNLINALVNKEYKSKIIEIFATQRPDLIISCWSIPNPIIETMLEEVKIPFINIVTDPRTFHVLMPTKHGVNLVFDTVAASRCKMLNIPASYIKKSGWFIRKEFYAPYQKQKVRKKLGLDPTIPTILVAAGSEGTSAVLKILPTFLQSTKNLNVFFACGNNKGLYSTIKNADEINHLLHQSSATSLIPLKFTNKLHEYIQASDLVVGKAGPNLLFETVATKTPFFAITHIAGQEDGNLDIIRDYNLGFVEERAINANRLLKRILDKPAQLEKFQPSLKKLSDFNQGAAPLLKELVKKLF